MLRRKILEDILGNYQMNYLTEFCMDIDIVLIIYDLIGCFNGASCQ